MKLGNDEIITFYYERRGTWILRRNERETFYDDQNRMREWKTEGEAIKWFEENHKNLR